MRKIIVFGGSAGGIESLCTVLKGLPADLPASALAVIHTTQKSTFLPHVLSRCTKLKVVSPENAEPIAPGKVYIAAPNRHLVVKSHCAVSWMGPRENRHRPAVDTLFRTAARAYRNHVIAVVLSGALDDGSAGALAVKARGGTVIVQDPKEAKMEDMPANVLHQVETDFCLPIAEIPALLGKLTAEGPSIKTPKLSAKQCRAISDSNFNEMEPSGLTCPECGGAVLEVKDGKNVQFRCHVGHTFSLETFSEAHADALERALWTVLRKLNEQRTIQENLAKAHHDNKPLQKRFLENVAAAQRDMDLLHEILARL